MRLQAYGLSQAPKSGVNFGCMCVGPLVGREAVRVELDASSSFLQRYGMLIAVADTDVDDWGVPASQILLEELAQRFYAFEKVSSDASQLRKSVGTYIDEANIALLSRLADQERVTSTTSLAGIALLD